MTDTDYLPSKKERGLYDKFKVERTDGSSVPGHKHALCEYFVLDTHCDPHAIPALIAYAASCEAHYPVLAVDLRKMARQICIHDMTNPCTICGIERDFGEP